MTFTEKDFETLRNFQNRMAKEFGDTAYVGTNNSTILVEYSPELKAMLRPYPPEKNFSFDLKVLSCQDCKIKSVFLCLPSQNDYVCDSCRERRKKKGAQKKEVAV